MRLKGVQIVHQEEQHFLVWAMEGVLVIAREHCPDVDFHDDCCVSLILRQLDPLRGGIQFLPLGGPHWQHVLLPDTQAFNRDSNMVLRNY